MKLVYYEVWVKMLPVNRELETLRFILEFLTRGGFFVLF